MRTLFRESDPTNSTVLTIDYTKGLFKKNLLFQNWKCHAYSNGKRSTVPESLIITALETVFLPKKFTRKRVQEMGEVTLVARKYC